MAYMVVRCVVSIREQWASVLWKMEVVAIGLYASSDSGISHVAVRVGSSHMPTILFSLDMRQAKRCSSDELELGSEMESCGG